MSVGYMQSSVIELFKSLDLATSLKNYDKLKISALDGVKIVAGTGGIYFIYQTIRIYQRRRKYKHIPGPKTNG